MARQFAIVSSILWVIVLPFFSTVARCQTLTAKPSPLRFGWVVVGTTSTLPLRVSASGATKITGIKAPEPFSVKALKYPYPLASGASVMVEVSFDPARMGQAGPQSLTIDYTGGSLVVDLYGTGKHTVTLTWDASATPDVSYNVYRGTRSGGPYKKINPEPVDALTYVDAFDTDGGDTFYYVAMAVDSSGESPHSNQVSAKVPAP